MISRPAKDQPSKELPSATAVIASETAAAAAAALRAEIDMGGTPRMGNADADSGIETVQAETETGPATGDNTNTITDTPKREKDRKYETDS
jgi:hypothetical protein